MRTQSVFGAELEEFYTGARAMAMGNAFTAIADDADAVFYNPAGLAFQRKMELYLLNPKIAISEDDIKAATDLKSVGSGFSADVISKVFGKKLYADATVFPALYLPSFVIGYYYNYDLHMVGRNLAMPQFETRYINDKGLVTGFGFETRGILKRHFFRFGISGKWLSRTGMNKTIPLSTLIAADAAYFKDLISDPGNGFGASAGVQYEIPFGKSNEIVLGSSWLDIGDTKFGKTIMSKRPPSIRSNLTAGIAAIHRLRGPADRTHNVKLAFELRHINEPYIDPFLRMHAGMELQLGAFSIQGGLNQDSLTGGVGFDFWFLRVTAVTYGVQTQSATYLDRERRYMVQAVLRFDLLGEEVPTNRDEERRKHPRKF
ncbi:MAG: hypothetical protein AB7F43_12820 [Bacteriovoracia bacterium]